jgi:hypothetical protein
MGWVPQHPRCAAAAEEAACGLSRRTTLRTYMKDKGCGLSCAVEIALAERREVATLEELERCAEVRIGLEGD